MPTKLASKDKVELRDRYVGETKRQLRHGYGVYKYDNKFFRYEGQWENGLKHGHGKLILGDGGYYEGKFERGEIQGHGYRVFGLSGTTYSGQFHLGQIHGQGLMRKTSGEQFEGSWVYGVKEGEGIFTDVEGGVYEGGFHDNKKHGEGRQMYSNGDQYEGEWVLGKRHGQGLQRCSNGTIYDGQWRGDVYHGEGSISHASGVTYTGIWNNGKPAREAAELVYVPESTTTDKLVVEQDKPFSLSFKCVDSHGELITLESGRSFKVTAAIKRSATSPRKKQKTGLSSSPSKDKIPVISTPFGYPAVSYSILQVPTIEDVPKAVSDLTSDKAKEEGDEDPPTNIPNEVVPQQKAADNELTVASSTNVEEFKAASKSRSRSPSQLRSDSLHPAAFEAHSTRSLLMGKKLDTATSEGTKAEKKDEQFLDSLVSPCTTQTTGGSASFKSLYIPPPPLPDILHIVTPSASLATSGKAEDPESRNKPDSRQLESDSRATSQALSAKAKKSSEKIKAEKERLLNPKREKYALPGTYVLIVSEITEPPFLGTHLPDLFVELKVVAQKTSKEQSIEKMIKSRSRFKVISKMSLLRAGSTKKL